MWQVVFEPEYDRVVTLSTVEERQLFPSMTPGEFNDNRVFDEIIMFPLYKFSMAEENRSASPAYRQAGGGELIEDKSINGEALIHTNE